MQNRAADAAPNLELLILQSTPFCNIDCSYCYLPDRQSKAKMPLPIVAATIERVCASGRLGAKLSVLWHAGEPLVMPIDYYEQAIDIIRSRIPSSTAVSFEVQTNGTLIDRDWCAFFARQHMGVGLSLDGPRVLHDRHRRSRTGRGTFERTMAGLRLLREAEIDCGVLAVLTRDSLSMPDAIYEFLVAEDIRRVSFNVEEIEGVNRASSLNSEGVEQEFLAFMHRFYARIAAGSFPIRVRELDHAFGALLGGRSGYWANQQSRPFSIVSVAATGAFSTFSPELLGQRHGEHFPWVIGNVLRDSFADAASRAPFTEMATAIAAGVAACQNSCAFYDVCGGGAPSNKLAEHGSFATTETMTCRLNVQALTRFAVEIIEEKGLNGSGLVAAGR